ncbi:MAG: adenine deaminase [Candidatus Adiutrix sp.]|jgi:adenine deaminase|nr:adenine deaminase [Candidatus Adiutrix sp.]
MDRDRLNLLIDMAAGRRPADLLIANCRLVDVFNQELIDGPLAVGQGLIVGFGPGYQARETVDAEGGVVLPGLIDGHVHIESSSLSPAQFARLILPFGTTAIVADPHEIANVSGLDGIRYMLEASRRLPLTVRIMLPSCVPSAPFEKAGAVLTAEDLESLIEEDGVLGLGEMMNYPGVINRDPEVIEKLLMAARHGRPVDGHSPGVGGRDLAAYVAAGIRTDHECSTLAEMKERLRLGQYVLMRLGSSANDLRELLKGVSPANARRCVLCTDDREAADILSTGHLNRLLRQCVADGFDPPAAVALATLNAAECFGLKGKGGLAPGWDADLVIVRDLKEFQVGRVFIAGREVARDGRLSVEPDGYVSAKVLNTVRLPALNENSFRLPLAGGRIRVIGNVPNSLLTENLSLTVKRNARGDFEAALNPGLNKLAVIERHRASGETGLGVLSGYGLKNGAIAASVAHDSHNLIVAGDNDPDMLLAAREVEKIGGGYAVVRAGELLAALPLPIGGLMSDRPAAEVAAGLEKIIEAAHRRLGLPETFHPLVNLIFLALPVIPELKLTSGGLFDVNAFRPVPICLDTV